MITANILFPKRSQKYYVVACAFLDNRTSSVGGAPYLAYKIHTGVRLSGPIWGGKVSPQGMLQDVALILVLWSYAAGSCEEAVRLM